MPHCTDISTGIWLGKNIQLQMTLLCCTKAFVVVTAKPSLVLRKNVVLPYQESYFLLLTSFFKRNARQNMPGRKISAHWLNS